MKSEADGTLQGRRSSSGRRRPVTSQSWSDRLRRLYAIARAARPRDNPDTRVLHHGAPATPRPKAAVAARTHLPIHPRLTCGCDQGVVFRRARAGAIRCGAADSPRTAAHAPRPFDSTQRRRRAATFPERARRLDCRNSSEALPARPRHSDKSLAPQRISYRPDNTGRPWKPCTAVHHLTSGFNRSTH